jgi:hypothetical protein
MTSENTSSTAASIANTQNSVDRRFTTAPMMDSTLYEE